MFPSKIVKKQKLSKQKGFTLVEVGIVVAIAAVIIGLGLVVVPSILSSNKANAEVSLIPAAVSKIQKAFSNQNDFSSATTAMVTKLNAFPNEQVNQTNGTITNRWNGAVNVLPTNLHGTDNDGAAITSANIPSAECVAIVQGVERTVARITVGTTVVKAVGDAAADPTAVGTACNAASTATIEYAFSK